MGSSLGEHNILPDPSVFHCPESFITTFRSSCYDLNIAEKDVKMPSHLSISSLFSSHSEVLLNIGTLNSVNW